MSHRSKYHNILVRNVCYNHCFEKYRSDQLSESRCDAGCALINTSSFTVSNMGCDRGGCGHQDPIDPDHDVFKQDPVKLEDLPQVLRELKGKDVFLFCLDFFDERNLDIFEALPYQKETKLAVDSCVASLWKNWDKVKNELVAKNICEVWLGVESANVGLRTSYKKPYFNNSQLKLLCDRLRELGIKYNFYMVTGPEDTKETLRENNELIRECQPEIAWYSLLVPSRNSLRGITQTNC